MNRIGKHLLYCDLPMKTFILLLLPIVLLGCDSIEPAPGMVAVRVVNQTSLRFDLVEIDLKTENSDRAYFPYVTRGEKTGYVVLRRGTSSGEFVRAVRGGKEYIHHSLAYAAIELKSGCYSYVLRGVRDGVLVTDLEFGC